MDELVEIEFYAHKNYAQIFETFKERFELVDVVIAGETRFSKKSLKPKNDRVCRFCGKKAGEVKFKSASHLFSELIGNKELFTDFECDNCNKKFGILENDLANYLGISRTVQRVSSKEGIPKFKSAGNELNAKARKFDLKEVVIMTTADANKGIIDNSERDKGIIKINYTKNPYIPASVFKILVKWAVSIFPESVVKYYQSCLKYLRGDIEISGGKIYGYRLPFQSGLHTKAFVFQKRNPEANTFTHLVVFCFQSHIICVPIPLCDLDYKLNGVSVELPVCPPIFTQFEPFTDEVIHSFIEDLSGKEKMKGVVETITLQMDPEQVKKTVAYDYKTDEILQEGYTAEKLRSIILMTDIDGIGFNKDGMKDFVLKILES